MRSRDEQNIEPNDSVGYLNKLIQLMIDGGEDPVFLRDMLEKQRLALLPDVEVVRRGKSRKLSASSDTSTL